MKTGFMNTCVQITTEDGLHGYSHLNIRIFSSIDTGYHMDLSLYNITPKDISNMITELQKAQRVIEAREILEADRRRQDIRIT